MAGEAWLHQVGQLRVAEGHVRVARSLGGEDARECGERLVDGLGLLEGRALGARAIQPLGARQVDKVESAMELGVELPGGR